MRYPATCFLPGWAIRVTLLAGLGAIVPQGVWAQPVDGNRPYWEYVRTEAGVVPYAADGCYQPTVHEAREGRVEITVTHCGNPPQARTRLRFAWTKPPRIVYPNEPFDFQLTTTLIENQNPDWVLGGSIWLRPEIVGEGGPYPGFGGGVSADLGKGSPTVVVWNNRQLPADRQWKGPPAWWAERSTPPGFMRLSVVAAHSNQHWWTYVYRWVKPGPVGYQLFFNGKLVSGADAAGYTRAQAEQNCRWNLADKPGLAIRCVYNGEVLVDRPATLPKPTGVWHVVERDTRSGQYWRATWQLKADGRSFDGHWQVFPGGQEGDLPNFARIRAIHQNQIVIDRPGLGTYTGTISSDRRRIEGTLSWCTACTWEVRTTVPLPQSF